ncbi:DUF4236 domain-containing protein [Synechococcus sp. CS-603]|uniref:DUF4236 domain-containing protein n=1 Tax=Synechococcus sp. CS-603 TaxID=2847981 RepID=UPI00288000C2|nr:DUF4236 domain-containing protein [Synechococcus sp. CS-603]
MLTAAVGDAGTTGNGPDRMGLGVIWLCSANRLLARQAGGLHGASIGLTQLREQALHDPLIAMPFRFRRSARLGPLRFNFAKSGLSSISVGGRGPRAWC